MKAILPSTANRIHKRRLGFIDWIKSHFAWKLVRKHVVWHYYENTITGERYACRVSRCWSPPDLDWVERKDPPTRRTLPPPLPLPLPLPSSMND